jgi:hypothetical protein
MASQAYTDAIKEDVRQVKGYVELVKQEETAKIGATVLGYDEASISKKDQVIDNERISVNYASFENEFFRTDGSMILPNTSSNTNIGYISADTDVSAAGVKITLASAQDVDGLTIYFHEGYADSFDLGIKVTGSSVAYETIINDREIVNITDSYVNLEYIEILTNSWNRSDRRARISEVDFSVSTIFADNELISFSTIEEMDKLTFSMPKNQTDVKVSNVDGLFDYINPEGIASFIDNSYFLKPYIGIVLPDGTIEYESLGFYYLTEWMNNDEKLTTTFTGLSLYNQLEKQRDLYRGTILTDTNLAGYITIMAIEYGWDKLLGTVADQKSTLGDQMLNLSNQLSQLQKIVMFGNSTVRVNRDNKIYVNDIDSTVTETLDLQHLLNYPFINIRNKIRQVKINASAGPDSYDTTTKTLWKSTRTVSGTETIFVELTETIGIISNVIVTGGTFNSIDARANFFEVNVTGAGVVTIEVQGFTAPPNIVEKDFDINPEGEAILITNEIITDDPVVVFTGGTIDPAQDVADHIDDNDDTYNMRVNYIGVPTIEPGQTVAIETPFGYKNFFITKQQLRFDGSLSGTLEGVGD